jgi:hypothetical protein
MVREPSNCEAAANLPLVQNLADWAGSEKVAAMDFLHPEYRWRRASSWAFANQKHPFPHECSDLVAATCLFPVSAAAVPSCTREA